MTKILNSKRYYCLEEGDSKAVLVIEYCNLKFICYLVLGIWNFLNVTKISMTSGIYYSLKGKNLCTTM